MEVRNKCSHAGFWIGLILLSLCLLASLLVNTGLFIALLMGSGQPAAVRHQAEDEFPRLTEKLSYGHGKTKVVRIPFSGVVTREVDDSLFGARVNKIEVVLRQIRAARHDKAVRAIILEIDSPGGGITPSDEIYAALMDFKRSAPRRKVVGFVKDMAASGGYYMASASDWIIAEPTAIIGSIGVIMQTLNWKGLSEKIGVTDTTIVSGTNKDLLNPFREVPPAQRALLQETVDIFYRRFFSIVQQARGIETNALQTLADGRIMSAEAALGHRLIDQVGYWDDVVKKTAALLDVASVSVIRYEQKPGFWDLLAEVRSPVPWSLVREAQTPQFLYLWRP